MDRREFLKGTAVAGGLAWASPLHAGEGNPPPLPTRPLGRTRVNVTVLALGGYTGMKEPRSDRFDPVQLASVWAIFGEIPARSRLVINSLRRSIVTTSGNLCSALLG